MNHIYIASITTILFCIINILDEKYIIKTKLNLSTIIKKGGIVFGSVYLAIYCLQLLIDNKVLSGGKLPTPAFIGSPEF